MQRRKFIVFEGIDGCGKTTQIDYLARHLRGKDKYNEFFLAREPTRGATQVVRRLREDADPDSDAMVMAQGYVEDRKRHWKRLIEPALNQGAIVICDRFTLSTLAYQSNQGIQLGTLRDMHTTRGIGSPEITFYLDIPVSVAQERMRKRGDSPEKFDSPDFQIKLAERYERIISLSKEDESLRALVGKIETVSAIQSIDELAKNIRDVYDSIIDQKIDAPPHLKRCGLIGARFLDAQRADHTLKCVVLGRHVDINNL